MNNVIVVKKLVESIDLILQESLFCNTCKYDHPIAIPDECADCVAGIPLTFKYEKKNEKL